MGTVIAFPNMKRRVEIRELDEQLAGIALRVRGLERQADALEAARDALEVICDRIDPPALERAKEQTP